MVNVVVQYRKQYMVKSGMQNNTWPRQTPVCWEQNYCFVASAVAASSIWTGGVRPISSAYTGGKTTYGSLRKVNHS